MTWGSTVLQANTPYESFHHRQRRNACRDDAERKAMRARQGDYPRWGSASSRAMARRSLELRERAQTARSTGSLTRRRLGTPRTPREIAALQTQALGLHFPLMPTPPPPATPTPPPPRFAASGGGGGRGFGHVMGGGMMRSLSRLAKQYLRLGYVDLDWLLALDDLDDLLSVCGTRRRPGPLREHDSHLGFILPSGAEIKPLPAPALVPADEEKKMRRHVKWKKRSEKSVAAELRGRLHSLLRPVYDKLVDAATKRAKTAVSEANRALTEGNYNVELLLTELNGAVRDPATPTGGQLQRDLYYNRALVLARSGRIDAALDDLDHGLAIDPADYRVLKAKCSMEKFRESQLIPSMDKHGDHFRAYTALEPAELPVGEDWALPGRLDAPGEERGDQLPSWTGKKNWAEAHRPSAASLELFLQHYPVKSGAEKLSNVSDADLKQLGMDEAEIQRLRRTMVHEKTTLHSTIKTIHRDRPFPEWEAKKALRALDRPPTPPPEKPPPPPPSPWNEVLDRVRDLLLDEVDDARTRQMMAKHLEQLAEIFVYYCRLGSSTTGPKAQEFARIVPHQLRPSKLTAEAKGRFCRLFWSKEGPLEDITAKEPILPELPTFLITLRQFWRLAIDCRFVDGDCTLADIGRIFTFSCRETELEGIEEVESRLGKGQDGYAMRLRGVRDQEEIDSVEELPELRDGDGNWKTLGGFDIENPHHPNNRQHILRFVETMLRCAHKRYVHEKKNLANCFDTFLADVVFPHACTHSYDPIHWRYHTKKMQACMAKYRAPLEKIYRYFSVPNPKAGVQTRDGQQMPLWKVRSASLLDNVFDFNEVFEMFEKAELFDVSMLPKKLCHLFEQVSWQHGILAQVHKNNNDNVMILEEFFELMMRVALAYSGTEAYRGQSPEECVDQYMHDLFQKCTMVMPINKQVLIKSMGQEQGLEESILPFETETMHSKLSLEADGAEAMAVRREPFPITVDVEAAAAKKRVAGVFEARKAEEERKQQEQAKLMGVRTDLAPRIVHSHRAS